MTVIRCDNCGGERAQKGGWFVVNSDLIPGRDGELLSAPSPSSLGTAHLCSRQCVGEWAAK